MLSNVVTEAALVVTKLQLGISNGITEQDENTIRNQINKVTTSRMRVKSVSFHDEQVRAKRGCGAIDMKQARVCRIVFEGLVFRHSIQRRINRLHIHSIFLDLFAVETRNNQPVTAN